MCLNCIDTLVSPLQTNKHVGLTHGEECTCRLFNAAQCVLMDIIAPFYKIHFLKFSTLLAMMLYAVAKLLQFNPDL